MSIAKIEGQANFPALEEKMIEFWKKNKIFEKSVENRPKDNIYSFIDGPPFVSGVPHYGHFITSIAKDVVPRYWAMKGKRVRRVWGWDCHGLPIEEKVNQKFTITSNSQVEKEFGVKKYVQACRDYVEGTISDWSWYIDRIGRWVDMDHSYRTMDLNFMESVIWAFKGFYDKGLIYKSKRVSLYSTDTQTPVGNFEVAMDPDNYRDVEDLAIFVKFKLSSDASFVPNGTPAFFLAWTTTPWTLPANAALAVNPEFTYVLVRQKGEYLILGKDRFEHIFGTERPEIFKELKGEELVGLRYEPLFDFYKDITTDNEYKVYSYMGVKSDEGTGILHIAPAFGEEDFEFGKENGVQAICNIDSEGKLTVGKFDGMYLRDANEPITKYLQDKNLLFKSEKYTHRLPFYRGENPLIYMAQEAYFVDIQKIKARMLSLNSEKIKWVPEYLKEGRFAETIATSPDWCISRNRFWATIIPIWKSDDGEELVIGSLEELAEYCAEISKDETGIYNFQGKPIDLHRDVCDDIVLKREGKTFHRIPEVLDCWMDSGSVPFAEHHYPFEHEQEFKDSFPADYIIEYTPQIRAWFSMLLRVSTILFDDTPFTNAVCHGTLLGNDGRKMSKSFNNYPDGREVLENIGGEALRLYLMGSPILSGSDMNWSDLELSEQVKNILLPIWNTLVYFTTYADLHGFNPEDTNFKPETALDSWLESLMNQANLDYQKAIESYDLPSSVRLIQPTIDGISTWWIRRSRDRIVSGDPVALQNLYASLVYFARIFAPQMPFVNEFIYQQLVTGKIKDCAESVHLEDYPVAGNLNVQILMDMENVRKMATIGQNIRKNAGFKLRQPLATLYVHGVKPLSNEELTKLLQRELNVKEIIFGEVQNSASIVRQEVGPITLGLETTLTPELAEEGKLAELIRQIQTVRKDQGLKIGEELELKYETKDAGIKDLMKKFETQISKAVFASSIGTGSVGDGVEVMVDNSPIKISFGKK